MCGRGSEAVVVTVELTEWRVDAQRWLICDGGRLRTLFLLPTPDGGAVIGVDGVWDKPPDCEAVRVIFGLFTHGVVLSFGGWG